MCASHPVDWPASRLWAQPRLSWLSSAMAERRGSYLVTWCVEFKRRRLHWKPMCFGQRGPRENCPGPLKEHKIYQCLVKMMPRLGSERTSNQFRRGAHEWHDDGCEQRRTECRCVGQCIWCWKGKIYYEIWGTKGLAMELWKRSWWSKGSPWSLERRWKCFIGRSALLDNKANLRLLSCCAPGSMTISKHSRRKEGRLGSNVDASWMAGETTSHLAGRDFSTHCCILWSRWILRCWCACDAAHATVWRKSDLWRSMDGWKENWMYRHITQGWKPWCVKAVSAWKEVIVRLTLLIDL